MHTKYDELDIVWHVSTMLKYTEGDQQQISRKRHIGNDIVVVIYQEHDESTTTSTVTTTTATTTENYKPWNPEHGFSPAFISSRFTHVYIVVRPVIGKDSTSVKYRVGVTLKEGVSQTDPLIPHTQMFEHGEDFGRWLVLKCINAEWAAYNASGFKSRVNAKQALLSSIFSTTVRET